MDQSEGMQNGLQRHIDELERVNMVLVQRLQMGEREGGVVQLSAPDLQADGTMTLPELQQLAESFKATHKKDPVFSIDQVCSVTYLPFFRQ